MGCRRYPCRAGNRESTLRPTVHRDFQETAVLPPNARRAGWVGQDAGWTTEAPWWRLRSVHRWPRPGEFIVMRPVRFLLLVLILLLMGDPAPRRAAAEEAGSTNAAPIRRVLFLGNSITLHGPKADIGWTGSWGMAASSAERDYVHLVQSDLTRHFGTRPEIRVRNIADFERQYANGEVAGRWKEDFAFEPDLAILAIGENVPALATAEDRACFKSGVLRLLAAKGAKRPPRWVVRSSFWPDAAKDEVLREACHEVGGVFVDMGALARDPANAARSERSFTHDGVASHPGDRGMRVIADALVRAILGGQGR